MDTAVQAFDLQRLLLGDEPPLFLLEIILRTLVVYIYALVLLHWLGSRAIGQLSTIEFLLVIALGSAVGDPMFQPEIPLIHSMLVITVVVLANKGLDLLIQRSTAAESLIDGRPVEAVRDGELSPDFLKRQPLTENELFQGLRSAGIRNLGELELAYVESDGTVTVFRAKTPKDGLAIVPPPNLLRLDDAPPRGNPRGKARSRSDTHPM